MATYSVIWKNRCINAPLVAKQSQNQRCVQIAGRVGLVSGPILKPTTMDILNTESGRLKGRGKLKLLCLQK